MTVELQPIINLAFGIVSGVCIWFFNKSADHEKRIQKIEDVQGNAIENLEKTVEKLEGKVDELAKSVNELIVTIKIKEHERNN
jgi:phage-related tail protein